MTSARVLLVGCGAAFGWGCGSSPGGAPTTAPTTATTPAEPVVAPADAAAPSVVIDAAPAFEVVLGPVIVEGDVSIEDVTSRLAMEQVTLGPCLGGAGPTTTELMFVVVGDAMELRSAWQNGAPLTPPPACLAALLRPIDGAARDAPRADVYVAVSAGPEGAAHPAAPPAPDRKDAFQRMFCELDKLSGADKLPVEKRVEAMTSWARTNVRHPAPFALAGRVGTWAPQGRDAQLRRALQAEGVKKCPMQRW